MKFDRVYIEISNICNLQCSFCPEVLRPKKLITPSEFNLILDRVKNFTHAVTLHVMGEPLAHPQFAEFLQILQKHSVPLILTSNGVLLNRHKNTIINISESKPNFIKQINFSVHSFFDNYPNKEIRTYLLDLIEFSKLFIRQNSESFINFRIWNLQKPNSIIEAKNLEIYQLLKEFFSNPELPSQLNVITKKSYRLDRHIKLHFDTEFEWPSLNSTMPASDGFCHGLRNQIAILTDGSVVPCCLDKEAIINLGSIYDSTLEEILATDRAQKIRLGFSQNLAVEELCQKCQFKTRFQ